MKKMERTFCLLKSEAYVFGKNRFIDGCIRTSGLELKTHLKVRLAFSDIFGIYKEFIPRMTSMMRLPPLFKLDMYILEGEDAINRMYHLKHHIRSKIWRGEYIKGGFLHAPDTLKEVDTHLAIVSRRIIRSSLSLRELKLFPVPLKPFP